MLRCHHPPNTDTRQRQHQNRPSQARTRGAKRRKTSQHSWSRPIQPPRKMIIRPRPRGIHPSFTGRGPPTQSSRRHNHPKISQKPPDRLNLGGEHTWHILQPSFRDATQTKTNTRTNNEENLYHRRSGAKTPEQKKSHL